ncbi:MAG: transporter monovalent cation:proton antiporter-2 (CPA2) family [Rhodocyclaceae bacterium]|nr:MAG: transporter monovalent cation:proton antiporter-2 (CPA2) family [Rhodocyclaceae bacterium]TND00736.1 MAG: transporter, monovalent cation:proton antiporter-2 (CPA2) family [Rhodocyclaceae bacterium]
MHQHLFAILLLLTAAVGAVSVVRRFRLPSMLAYLAIGIALGPHGLALLAESAEVQGFAEFGVVFLMFSIGLEFSLKRLQAMRSLVFGFGSAQMALTALGTGLVTALAYGQGWRSGVAVGLAVAMSSTAIVAKMLSDRFELHSRSGRQTMGVLLFQDLAVAPCLILLPALAASGDDLWRSLAIAAAQMVAVLALLIWVGQKLMGRIFDAAAKVRSNELLVLTTLWIVVGLSFLTAQSGLSLALGAFVGGMLISETVYRHHVEADIRPFRDILLGLFFVTVGMMLDIQYVLANAHKLMLALVLLIGGKAAVMLLITRVAKTPLVASLRTSAQLAQGGEFGLVLIGLAHQLQLISTSAFQITLSAMLLSMFIAPFLIARAASLSGDLGRGDWAHKAAVIHNIAVHSLELGEHVVICGYGRTGGRIAEFLAIENIPFIALDVDPQRIAEAGAQGINVVFGNADRPEVLQAAGIARARAVVVSYPDAHSAERVLRIVRSTRPAIPIVVRTADDRDVARLKAAGATEVIPEVLESSLLIAAETLVQAGIPMKKAIQHVRAARAERYASLRDFYETPPKK